MTHKEKIRGLIGKRNEENRVREACKGCLTVYGRAARMKRLKMGLSIKGLAKKMGTTPSQVLHIELHSSDISLSMLVRLARALEVHLDYFVTVGAK